MKVWIAIQEDDNDNLMLLTRTKKELQQTLKNSSSTHFIEAWQLEFNTSDIFDLLYEATGEGGGRNGMLGKRIAHYKIESNGELKKIPINCWVDNDGNIREFRR